jgi:hypothetical protein
MTTRDIDLEDINEHIARDDAAKVAGVLQERARVLAYLRSAAATTGDRVERVSLLLQAKCIERGEHLR